MSVSYKLDDETFYDEEYQKRCVRVMPNSTIMKRENSAHDTNNRDSSRSNSHINENESEDQGKELND